MYKAVFWFPFTIAISLSNLFVMSFQYLLPLSVVCALARPVTCKVSEFTHTADFFRCNILTLRPRLQDRLLSHVGTRDEILVLVTQSW